MMILGAASVIPMLFKMRALAICNVKPYARCICTEENSRECVHERAFAAYYLAFCAAKGKGGLFHFIEYFDFVFGVDANGGYVCLC